MAVPTNGAGENSRPSIPDDTVQKRPLQLQVATLVLASLRHNAQFCSSNFKKFSGPTTRGVMTYVLE